MSAAIRGEAPLLLGREDAIGQAKTLGVLYEAAQGAARLPSEMAPRASAALGEIIRQQRELTEMSMRQFAELAGISNREWSQIE